MKLKVLALLITCSALCFTLTAEAKPFEVLNGKILFGGQGRVRFEYFDNTNFTGGDQREFVLTRIRPYIDLRPHEQVSIFFEPQFTGGWGETGLSLNAVNSTTAGTTASTSGALNDPTLGVHQGYIQYGPSDWFYMKAGRQELVYGDELVIGAVNWNNVGRSFDALKLRFTTDPTWIDVFFSFLSDSESGQARGVATTPLGDAIFTGVYSSSNLGRFAKALDFYALYLINSTTSPRLANFATIGARLKSKPTAVDYRFEGDGQIGKAAQGGIETDQHDYQFDLEAGYTFEQLAKFRIGVEGLIASKNYNQLFPTAHKWLGYIDLFGRRNVMGGVLHLSVAPTAQWLVKLDTQALFRNSTAAGLYRLNGVTPIGATGPSTSHYGGTELDLTTRFKPLDVLAFQAGFSVFIPGGFIADNVGSSVPLFGYLQTNVQF